jgi:hypothetical protein
VRWASGGIPHPLTGETALSTLLGVAAFDYLARILDWDVSLALAT